MRGDMNAPGGYSRIPWPLDGRVRELIEHQFWLHGRHQKVQIEGLTTGCGDPEANASQADRFRMKWHHEVLGTVTWWVILNSSNVKYPPDFIFHEQHFLPPMHKLQSLVRWDATSHHALVKVIEELMVALQMHELKQVPEAIRQEYDVVINMPEVDKRFCSVSVPRGPQLAEFWIRLSFDEDPNLFTDIHYKLGGQFNRQTQLQVDLSPGLSSTVGNVRYNVDESSLERVVKSVHRTLSEYLLQEKQSIRIRRDVLREVLILQGDTLLEVDMELFRSAVFLMKSDEVYVEVAVRLPQRFLTGCNLIELHAKDVYNKLRPMRQEISCDGAVKEIPERIFQATADATESIAQQLLGRASAL